MAERLRRLKPEQIKGAEVGRHHRISLMEGRKEIGSAELTYHGSPVPLYYLGALNVVKERRATQDRPGAKYGSRLMDEVEKMLLEKKKMGLVQDGIDPNSPARGMYARRGWRNIPELPNWFVFNAPEELDFATLKDIDFKTGSRAMRELRMRLYSKFKRP